MGKKNASYGWHSLRFRIVLVSVLVEVVMLSILVWNSTRVSEDSLVHQAQHRMTELLPVLNTAIAPSMLAEDTATLHEILTKIISNEGIRYAAIFNSLGTKLGKEGTSQTSHISDWGYDFAAHIQNEGINQPYKLRMPVHLGDYELGYLELEMDTEFIHQSTSNIRQQGIIIASIEVILSVVLLTLIGIVLTRKLYLLTEAAQKMSEGDLSVRTDVPGHDEVSATADAFNKMAVSIFEQTNDLQKEHKRLDTLLDSMDVGIVFSDSNDVIQYHNTPFTHIWQLEKLTQIKGENLLDIQEKASVKVARSTSPELIIGQSKQSRLYLNNNKIILQTRRRLSTPSGDDFGCLWMYEDITTKHQAQKQLTYLAEHDALTGLYNRYRFKIELRKMAKTIHRKKHCLVLFFFDLDEFKSINDTYGHGQGDDVLVRIANSINSFVREEDVFCRIGGDEFAILAVMDEHDEAINFAQRIIQTIAKLPFKFNDKPVRLTTSVGVTYYPGISSSEDMLSHADIAMYSAKSKGKNTYCLYEPGHDNMSATIERLNWNKRLDNAFENNLFELHFQGIYCVKTGKIVHLETLIRLRDEDNLEKLISPGNFIPFAEKSGKILEIDRWVIEQASKLLGENSLMPPLAINISGRSFDQRDLPDFIGEQIRLNDIDPKRLLIELTETEAVSDIQDAKSFIEGLHKIGCPVCLDDFGAGFSSFSYLKHLTVEILKIDGLFVQNLDTSYENQLFVESMLHVSRGLKKETIAEFVENRDIFEKLQALGVDMAQGYYLDKPMKDHPSLTQADYTFEPY